MDFEEIYIPLEWADTVTGHPFLLETYGEELDMVRNAAPEHVWTLIDGTSKPEIISNYNSDVIGHQSSLFPISWYLEGIKAKLDELAEEREKLL